MEPTRKMSAALPVRELRAALGDPALREEIRRRYGVEVQDVEEGAPSEFEDAPEQQKTAIFNSW